MILLLTLSLEWLFGDPSNRWHPVAWFGRWASWCESFLYSNNRQAGIVTWLFVVIAAFVLLWLGHILFGWVFDALLLWLSIGWKSLFQHVHDVLSAKTVKKAREALALIVSRDVKVMKREETRRSALESLAENASDAVIAPLFWFVVLGPLGAALYRMMNTLDAMWGYRNTRYEQFGWCAAKVDDVVNWLPARITARLMLWVGESMDWQQVRIQASTHASPNAGYPEVALAYAADIRLGGSVIRDGKVDERPWYGAEDARDVDAIVAREAMNIVRNTLILAALLVFGISLVI
ncbi:MAG: adenosylcobinamide-phosphate synthase CbiB [Mariprofundaceae bacterium]|nr:adenosylcobinamide-phosphate synthase CbiB [Mariprofundaceae bacterium]